MGDEGEEEQLDVVPELDRDRDPTDEAGDEAVGEIEKVCSTGTGLWRIRNRACSAVSCRSSWTDRQLVHVLRRWWGWGELEADPGWEWE